jgi:hypothetical protein
MKLATLAVAALFGLGALAAPTAVISGGPLQKKYHTGYVKPKNHGFGTPYFQLDPHFRSADFPEHFDWKDEGVETPVRNHGNCGSCWAFASVQTLEGAMKRLGKVIDFSEQQVTSCYKEAYGCNGGWFAGKLLVNPGLTTEEEYPYVAKTGRCRTNITPVEKAVTYGFAGPQGGKPTTDQIKEAIMQYGFISATVSATNKWGSYKGGTFKGCSGGQTNHMVTLTGWKTENGKTIWRMKNSWGTGWGDNGYMDIPAGCDRIGEEAAFVTVQDTPGEVPKVAMPAEIMVNAGDEIVLAVKKQTGVNYTWMEGNAKLGEGSELIHAFTKDTVVKLLAKNNFGTAEVATKVTVRKP